MRRTADGFAGLPGPAAGIGCASVRFGLDSFLEETPGRHGRLGWLASGAAVTSDRLVWGPVAAQAAGFELAQLFALEHGPQGAIGPGERVADSTDPWTGLPVCSLYPPTPGRSATVERALARCDTLVLDIVELGARYSTNLALVADLLATVAGLGGSQKVVVLDRPNPLGRTVEGPRLGQGLRSIVGHLDIPVRYGLTVAELVRWHVRSADLHVEIEVFPTTGWDPARVAAGAAPFLPPSPNLNMIEAQLLYVGTCLVEGTNLSEGRGTATPFQVVGAPWLDARSVVAKLHPDHHEAVIARPVRFMPSTSKHAGMTCEGVFFHVVDHNRLRPLEMAIKLLYAVFSLHGEAELSSDEQMGGQRYLDLLWGSTTLGDALAARREPAPLPRTSGFADEVHWDLLYEAPVCEEQGP